MIVTWRTWLDFEELNVRTARDSLEIFDSTIAIWRYLAWLDELGMRDARDSQCWKFPTPRLTWFFDGMTRRPLRGRLDLTIFGSMICTCRSWRVLTCFKLSSPTYLLICLPAWRIVRPIYWYRIGFIRGDASRTSWLSKIVLCLSRVLFEKMKRRNGFYWDNPGSR